MTLATEITEGNETMSTQVLKTHYEMVDGKPVVVTEDVTAKAFWDDVHFNEAMASIPTIVGGVEQTAPRVTIEQIEAEIKHEFYFTAAEGVHGTHEYPGSSDGWSVPKSMDRTLFCVLVLKNGMRVEGVSHSISEASTMPLELVKQNTRKKAIDKLWPMFGFELAQKLHKINQAPKPSGAILCQLGREHDTVKTYLGTKVVHAFPMTKHAYDNLRNWDAEPAPDQEGYMVEYVDGGKPNVEGFTGYISWSPKEVFERSYSVS
jgi:hypothetical protein